MAALYNDNYNNLLECYEVLNPVTNVTVRDVYLNILAYYMSYSVSDVEIVQLCKIVNFALGKSIFPQTTYLFNQQFKDSYGTVRYTFICDQCHNLLETKLHEDITNNENVPCASCGNLNTLKLSNEHFFVTFEIKEQIKAVFSKRDVTDYFRRPSNNGVISDVYDGELYCELSQAREINGEEFITYNFNIDSAPLFNSSGLKLTPILLSINELPLSVRNQNIIVAGFWCSPVPVNYNLFLETFAENVSSLEDNGVMLQTRNDLIIEVKCKALAAPLDSVARAPSMNMDQYNGYESCFKCDIVGEYIENCVKFPLGEDLPQPRTEEDLFNAATVAVNSNTIVNGVKGFTPLALIRSFKCVRGFPVENLHASILGVTRQFTKAWVTGDNDPRAVYYIGSPAKLHAAKEILKRFKLPAEEKDFIPDLKKRSLWKGSNWRDYLLYMTPSLVTELLPDEYAQHWMLFVKGLYLLMTNNITEDTLRDAQQLFISFNLGVQDLYGPKFMTYNVHLLLHLPDTVRNCGPLFACSAFPFESFLYILKNMVHAYKGAAQQLVKKILLRNNLLYYINSRNIPNATIQLLRTFPIKLKTEGGVISYVILKGYTGNNLEMRAIRANNIFRNRQINFCRSFRIGSFYLKASANNGMNDTVNSVVAAIDGNHYKIRSIFYVGHNADRNQFYFIGQKLDISNVHNNFLPHMKQFDSLTNNVTMLRLDDIKCKCMYVNEGRVKYVIEILTCHEAD